MAKKTYLEREAVIKYLSDVKSVCMDNLEFETADNLDEIIREISEGGIPAAHIASVKHGFWKDEYLGYGITRYRCSCCGSTFGMDQIEGFGHNNYCADCGAKMN